MENQMIIEGKHNEALVYTKDVEEKTIEQIRTLCDQEFVKGSKIRIMPDVHLGLGCTIGTTMTIEDKVVPNLVGVDIGCGVEVAKLKEKDIDLEKLDRIIHKNIPAGFKIRRNPHKFNEKIDLSKLRCKGNLNYKRAKRSIGTLGGGNHFIEVNEDKEGNLYLAIHSGSRNIGNQLAQEYQKKAIRKGDKSLPRDLRYLEGKDFDNYIHDMEIIQRYADINRKAMVHEIVENMGLTVVDSFSTIHNYIDTENMILRKGAVSAKDGEEFIIPLNMRDGSLLCIGKGNPDWNYSAPHGAGRVLSRTQARKTLDMGEYKEMMKDVYSTSVSNRTLDEAPLAYKPVEDIKKNSKPTADIIERIKPIYNFKA